MLVDFRLLFTSFQVSSVFFVDVPSSAATTTAVVVVVAG